MLWTYSSVSSFGLILCWFLCIRLKQPPFPFWRSCVDEPYCSILPQLLAVSQNLWLSKQPALFLLAPSIWWCAKSCQCPKKRFSVNPQMKIDWKPDPKVATFKVYKEKTKLKTHQLFKKLNKLILILVILTTHKLFLWDLGVGAQIFTKTFFFNFQILPYFFSFSWNSLNLG